MAKSKNSASSVEQEALPQQGTGRFTRRAAVMVPTLKIADGQTVYVHVTGPIQVRQSKVKGDDGVERLKDIEIIPIVNLETSEIMSMVAGAALSQNLKDYKGGNQQYVGLAFEITKHKAAEGKRWKAYSMFEIDAASDKQAAK